jgi:hypothetical protein
VIVGAGERARGLVAFCDGFDDPELGPGDAVAEAKP